MIDLKTTKLGRVRRTSHSHVVNELGLSIVRKDFPAGTILPGDKELAEHFDVSRTVLREAMKTLSAKGMIVPRARVGTRVTNIKHWNLFDTDVLEWHFECGVHHDFLVHLVEIRLAFEPHAASLAAQNATEEDMQRLLLQADDMGKETHTAESLANSDLQFHLAVLDASQNPFMRSVGSIIQAALTDMLKRSAPTKEQIKANDVYHNHKKIADAIVARDPELAAQAMRDVIFVGKERLLGTDAKAEASD